MKEKIPCHTKLCAFRCLIPRPQNQILRSGNQIRCGKLLLSRKLFSTSEGDVSHNVLYLQPLPNMLWQHHAWFSWTDRQQIAPQHLVKHYKVLSELGLIIQTIVQNLAGNTVCYGAMRFVKGRVCYKNKTLFSKIDCYYCGVFCLFVNII